MVSAALQPDEPTGQGAGDPPAAAPDGAAKGRRRKKGKPQDFSQLTEMLDRFVLLYGTKTVFDREKSLLMPMDALSAAFPNWFRTWKEHGDRRMVDQDRLVFEPARKLGAEWLNLWRGWPNKPQKGDCSKLLKLLWHLVDGDAASMAWILRWIAFPLRYPGTKMRTAIVMHGDEGSGKNLFWETVKSIYGHYGTIITQDQLEDKFNGWISCKLFAIADEVVSRAEIRHVKGRLKAYITSTELILNEKHLPSRAERNCLNMVFLSNEIMPMALDDSDRRYHVVWTPPKLSREFYAEVAAEIEAGGMQAFYWYLLHEVDMGDFDAHAKPLDTEARRKLIELGRPSPQGFYQDWVSEAIPVPFCSCASRDLYQAYDRWCRKTGERFPIRLHVFVREIERYLPRAVKWVTGEKQLTVFVVRPELRPSDMTEADWLAAGVTEFREKLGQWTSGS